MTETNAKPSSSRDGSSPAAAAGDASPAPDASGIASAADPSVTPARPHGVGARGGRGWFAGLDGLRAIAAFGVILTHVSYMTGYAFRGGAAGEVALRGDVGIALFFVLSGFLLYRPFVSARLDGRAGPAVQRYLRHRFLRIFPAYWVALTVLAVVLDTRERQDLSSPWELVMYYGLLQSFSTETVLGGLSQAWTLHNEIMFYLLLPFWAAGAAWLGHRLQPRKALRVELAVLAGVAVGCLAWRMWVQAVRVDYLPDGYDPRLHWLLGNFHMFVPGMVLALGLEWSRRRDRPLGLLEAIRRHPLVCWTVAVVSFWAVSTQIGLGTLLGAEGPLQDLVKELLYASVGFFLVAPVALAGNTLPRSLSWLSSRVMVTLGVLSYGIYLWHVGVIDIYLDVTDRVVLSAPFLPTLAVTAVGSVAVAAVSYMVVERPALKLKGTRPRPDAAGRDARAQADAPAAQGATTR